MKLAEVANIANKRVRQPPPPPAAQKEMIERAEAVEIPSQALLNQFYRPAEILANAALPIVWGVMIGAGLAYIHGVVGSFGLLPSGAMTPYMQGLAGLFGLSGGVIFARSSPKVRRLTSGEGDVAQQKISIVGMVERLRLVTSYISRNRDVLPQPTQTRLLELSINPALVTLGAASPDKIETKPDAEKLNIGAGVGRKSTVTTGAPSVMNADSDRGSSPTAEP